MSVPVIGSDTDAGDVKGSITSLQLFHGLGELLTTASLVLSNLKE